MSLGLYLDLTLPVFPFQLPNPEEAEWLHILSSSAQASGVKWAETEFFETVNQNTSFPQVVSSGCLVPEKQKKLTHNLQHESVCH